MRLIDGDALIDQIEKNICEPCKKRKEDYNGVRCRACQYGDEMDDIEDAPTIEERKKGGWIIISEFLGGCTDRCSVCGWEYDYNGYVDEQEYYNFCPNCGADMRGEDNG